MWHLTSLPSFHFLPRRKGFTRRNLLFVRARAAGDVCPSHDCSRLLTALDVMGHDSPRLFLLAAGLTCLAGADTVPSCWVCENIFVNEAVLTRRQDGCGTTAIDANPACYLSYGAGIQLTSCYCGPNQQGYLTDLECCANERCAATDFSSGRVVARSICASSVLPPRPLAHLLTILQTRTT